jgi:hypothetical protein
MRKIEIVERITEAEIMPSQTLIALKAVIERPWDIEILGKAKRMLAEQQYHIDRCINIVNKEGEKDGRKQR